MKVSLLQSEKICEPYFGASLGGLDEEEHPVRTGWRFSESAKWHVTKCSPPRSR